MPDSCITFMASLILYFDNIFLSYFDCRQPTCSRHISVLADIQWSRPWRSEWKCRYSGSCRICHLIFEAVNSLYRLHGFTLISFMTRSGLAVSRLFGSALISASSLRVRYSRFIAWCHNMRWYWGRHAWPGHYRLIQWGSRLRLWAVYASSRR